MKQQKGFTLIELLIVIAIIGVLASFLVPAVTRAMRNSHRVSAMNNMKQFTAWMIQYTNDNKDRLAEDGADGGGDWSAIASDDSDDVWYNALPNTGGAEPLSDMVPRGGKSTMYGPGSLFYLTGAKYPGNSNSRAYFSFAMNRNLTTDSGKPPKMSSISKTSRTVMFGECGMPSEAVTSEQQPLYTGDPAMYANQFIGRYGKKTGVLGFADGHALYYTRKKIMDNLEKSPQTEIIWTVDPSETPQ